MEDVKAHHLHIDMQRQERWLPKAPVNHSEMEQDLGHIHNDTFAGDNVDEMMVLKQRYVNSVIRSTAVYLRICAFSRCCHILDMHGVDSHLCSANYHRTF